VRTVDELRLPESPLMTSSAVARPSLKRVHGVPLAAGQGGAQRRGHIVISITLVR
jgi:hypothetical protein